MFTGRCLFLNAALLTYPTWFCWTPFKVYRELGVFFKLQFYFLISDLRRLHFCESNITIDGGLKINLHFVILTSNILFLPYYHRNLYFDRSLMVILNVCDVIVIIISRHMAPKIIFIVIRFEANSESTMRSNSITNIQNTSELY